MINLLVEIKNEYLIHIINIISPFIMQGIQGIYNDSLAHMTNQKIPDVDIFKIFQIYLKGILNWSNETIEKETTRITNNSQKYNNNIVLSDLLKATIKSHIVILMYDPSLKLQTDINKKLYNIKLCDFIHKVYIECAIEFWNNPYLFYHDYPSIEIKRNYKDCITIIKECIKESIRKILPLKYILEYYLHENITPDNELTNKIGKQLSENENMYLNKLINKDLYDISDSNKDNNKSLLELSNRLLEYNDNNSLIKNKKKCNLSPNDNLYDKTNTLNIINNQDSISEFLLDSSLNEEQIKKNNFNIQQQKNQQFNEELSEKLNEQINVNKHNIFDSLSNLQQDDEQEDKQIKQDKRNINKQINNEQQRKQIKQHKRNINEQTNQQEKLNVNKNNIFDILSTLQQDDVQEDEQINNEQINNEQRRKQIKQHKRNINEQTNQQEKLNVNKHNIFDILSNLQQDDVQEDEQINNEQRRKQMKQHKRNINEQTNQQEKLNVNKHNIFDILSNLQHDEQEDKQENEQINNERLQYKQSKQSKQSKKNLYEQINDKQVDNEENLQLKDELLDNNTIDYLKYNKNNNRLNDTSEKQSKKLKDCLTCNNKNILSDKIKGILHKMENISDTVLSNSVVLNYQDIFSNSD